MAGMAYGYQGGVNDFDRNAIGWGSLYVMVRQPNGKYKREAVKTSELSDAQIRDALARPDNAGALAPGWARTPAGAIIKTPTVPSVMAAPPSVVPGSSTDAGTGAVDPATGKPAAPTKDQFTTKESWDNDYFESLARMRGELGLVQDPVTGLDYHAASRNRLAGLNAQFDDEFKPVETGGRTMYDLLASQAEKAYNAQLGSVRSDAAKKGIKWSGYADRGQAEASAQNMTNLSDLRSNWGTDVTRAGNAAYKANQEGTDALARYTAAKAEAERSAAQRAYEKAANNYSNMYGGY